MPGHPAADGSLQRRWRGGIATSIGDRGNPPPPTPTALGLDYTRNVADMPLQRSRSTAPLSGPVTSRGMIDLAHRCSGRDRWGGSYGRP